MTDIVERLREGITLYSAALENSDKHMDLLSEAADEIEQLRNKIAYSTALAEEAVVLIENLKAERDAAVKDAERYRWLRKIDREFINDDWNNVGAIQAIMVCDQECSAIGVYENEMDAAIDAARGEA